jgi:4-amino-4-deoxy-L-arabinose transferase-like glycosyltransferase/membrane-associated phospholipid phosphatase
VHWLQELDLGLLRFFNQTLSNPFFDKLMPFASGNSYFIPVAILGAILLLWKGGARARLCLLMLALIVGPGDGLVINTIKHAVGRPRPFVTHADILMPASKAKPDLKAAEDKQAQAAVATAKPARRGGYNGMPSAHAANWFAATMICFIYYRRSLRFMLPLACLVTFSRLYNGVHYPSDVLAGAILGAGYAAAGLWILNALWRWIGRKWFPLWWQKLPSLVTLESRVENSDLPSAISPISPPAQRLEPDPSDLSQHWIHLGYIVIVVLLFARLLYIASGTIELSGDEAYQWIWSKHLALSYYSKPPIIAYTQWLGTHLWGDTELGVRFFSPVLAAITSFLLLRFMAHHVSGRAAVALLLITATTPLLSVGSTLLTIDPLSVFFWILAMLAGWRAAQPGSKTSDWLWTGLWMGLGFLSKYTGLFQLLCWAVFFILWKPARQQLRRPGPYLALLVNAICTVPVLIWNSRNDWVTLSHLATNANLNSPKWTPRIFDFIGLEMGLLNPIYFVAAMWAMIAFWRPLRRNVLAVYLFSMGAPLFLCYLLWSLHSRILPNWIAPSVLPLFCLMIVYWNQRWNEVTHWARRFLATGFILGLVFVILGHNTDIVKSIVGKPLPPKIDPLTRVRGFESAAQVVDGVRQKLQADGRSIFIIGDHYQITGLLTFYLPEARTNVMYSPLVYASRSRIPKNQFYFWPGYREQRKGQDAIYVRTVRPPPFKDGWFLKWLQGETDLLGADLETKPPPVELLEDFESVKSLGKFDTLYRGRVLHTYQIFECRNVR